MPDPSANHGPNRGREHTQHLGDAKELLAPYIRDRSVKLSGYIPFEAPADNIPYSEVVRDTRSGLLKLTVNIPGLVLGRASWMSVSNTQEMGPICRATHEILEDLDKADRHFTEINFMPAAFRPDLKTSQFDYHFEVQHTDKTRPQMGYLKMSFEFLESEKYNALSRAGAAIDNIIGFCALHGLQRTIQRIVHNAAEAEGAMELRPLELPLPDELTDTPTFLRLLPDEATDRTFKFGGDLGKGRPFVEIKGHVLNVRIPCSSMEADNWSYYLNNCKIAEEYEITASYVDLPHDGPQLRELLDQLSLDLSAFPNDEDEISSRPTRKEPGYWHIRVPLDPNNQYEGLQGALEFITAFSETLLHGTDFWSKGTN